MNETISPEQQLKQLEEDYTRRRVEIQKQAGESTEVMPSEHETLSHAVEETIQQHAPNFQASSHAAQSTDDTLPPEDQAKIQQWINDAFARGIDSAIKEARDSGDMALLDAFHKALTGQLHETLVQQGKLTDLP